MTSQSKPHGFPSWVSYRMSFVHNAVTDQVKILGAESVRKCHLSSKGILIIKVRQFHDHFIFIIGIPTLVRWHLYMESSHWCAISYECVCAKEVTPLLMHWSYVAFALTYSYDISPLVAIVVIASSHKLGFGLRWNSLYGSTDRLMDTYEPYTLGTRSCLKQQGDGTTIAEE